MNFKEFFKFDKPRIIFTIMFFVIVFLGFYSLHYCENIGFCMGNSPETLELLIVGLPGIVSTILMIPAILIWGWGLNLTYYPQSDLPYFLPLLIRILFSFVIEYILISTIINFVNSKKK